METKKDIDDVKQHVSANVNSVLAKIAEFDTKFDLEIEKVKRSKWTPIIVGGALVLAFFLGWSFRGDV